MGKDDATKTNGFMSSREMNNQMKSKNLKIPVFLLVLVLLVSLIGIGINAILYGVAHKEVVFSSQESRIPSLKPIGPTMSIIDVSISEGRTSSEHTVPDSNPEPDLNVTYSSNNSMHAALNLYESLTVSDGGRAVRENQVAAQTMDVSAQIFSWSFTNLESFEDATKGKQKLKKRLEWVSFKTGITRTLDHLD